MDAQVLENLHTDTILASGLTYAEYVQQFMGDERHTEWVHGEVIHILNNVQHNRILGLLQTLLTLYLRFKALGEVFPAGISMYISDDKPAREPDLMIVFNENRHRLEEIRLNGAADIYQPGEDGRYRRAALDSQGRLLSPLLPDFALDAELLWQEDLPTGAELMAMVGA
jgi:Uma2 family endonuclease